MRSKKRQSKPSVTLSAVAFILVLLIILIAGIFYYTNQDPRDTMEQFGSMLGVSSSADPDEGPEKTAGLNNSKTTQPDTSKTPSDNNAEYSLKNIMPIDGQFNLIMLDVGQGDSLFVQSPQGKTMLIDTGEYQYWDRLDDYLKQLGVSRIDALVATHPHSDHIGSMQSVINHYEIGEIYMPRVSHTSKTYENLLETIKKHDRKIVALKGGRGQKIELDSDIVIEVMAPLSESYENLNDYSAVFRIEYKNNSFLLTGDAENISEREMVDHYGKQLRSDVIKVPHHGSNTSSKSYFLEEVKPTYALISCMQNNEYNHPHQKAVTRLNQIGAKIFRTDLSGSILVSSDGNHISVSSSR